MVAPNRGGALWVVGTPIGNLEDLSPRALRVLASADAIFCEDTRVTAKLAARFEITAPRISCPAPREASREAELLRRLDAGENIAFVSDAGMPGSSDPGERLVAAASSAGFSVFVVPGPSAVSAALAICGLPAVPHVFLGFLPSRKGERRRALEDRLGSADALIWFESPHRLVESLEDAADILGPRRACAARELTKIHEEVVRGTLPEIAAVFRGRGAGRGEITVVVEGRPPEAVRLPRSEVDRLIREGLARGENKRVLARQLATLSGLPAREIYARAVMFSDASPSR